VEIAVGKRSNLSAAERREAVLSVIRKEEPLSVVARRYGVSDVTLAKWRDQFIDGGVAALSTGGGQQARREVEQLQREVARRDQVIGELTIANRILKKTGHPLS
jgi:transposase